MNRSQLFVSYSHEDANRIRPIVQALNDLGISVWIDQDQLGVGESIPGKIDEGLQNSRAFLLFASQAYFASRWTALEWQAALALGIAADDRKFLVVRLDQTPLPAILGHLVHVAGGDQPASVAQRITSAMESHPLPTGHDSSKTEIKVRWQDLDDPMLDLITDTVISRSGELLHQNGDLAVASIIASPESALTLCVVRALLANRPLITELRAELEISRTHRYFVAEYRKMLAEGGLGTLTPAFALQLQRRVEQLQASRNALREQMERLAPQISMSRPLAASV